MRGICEEVSTERLFFSELVPAGAGKKSYFTTAHPSLLILASMQAISNPPRPSVLPQTTSTHTDLLAIIRYDE